MKSSFWISLLVFCLLMCSCKTQKAVKEINFLKNDRTQTELSRFESLTDTSNVLKIEIDKSKLKIIETIKITEYDAQSGKPIKETDAKREIMQDSNQVVTEEKEQTVTNRNQLKVNQSIDTNKKVESEVTEESEDASVALWREIGRWIGIVIAFILAFKIFWPSLKKKF